MRPGPWSFALLTTVVSISARAQTATPPPTPPPYSYPPPYYAPYPPAYPQQAPYPYAPPQYKPPEVLPYKEGAPIPTGYHVEERPRRGLVMAGWLLTGISYGIGVTAALSASFKNESGWLLVPFAGPWLTMGRRDYGCDDDNNDQRADDSAACVADIFIVMGLIMSGTLQAAGGTLLMIGYVSTKQQLVRDEAKLRIVPMRIGSGRGLGLSGAF